MVDLKADVGSMWGRAGGDLEPTRAQSVGWAPEIWGRSGVHVFRKSGPAGVCSFIVCCSVSHQARMQKTGRIPFPDDARRSAFAGAAAPRGSRPVAVVPTMVAVLPAPSDDAPPLAAAVEQPHRSRATAAARTLERVLGTEEQSRSRTGGGRKRTAQVAPALGPHPISVGPLPARSSGDAPASATSVRFYRPSSTAHATGAPCAPLDRTVGSGVLRTPLDSQCMSHRMHDHVRDERSFGCPCEGPDGWRSIVSVAGRCMRSSIFSTIQTDLGASVASFSTSVTRAMSRAAPPPCDACCWRPWHIMPSGPQGGSGAR